MLKINFEKTYLKRFIIYVSTTYSGIECSTFLLNKALDNTIGS